MTRAQSMLPEEEQQGAHEPSRRCADSTGRATSQPDYARLGQCFGCLAKSTAQNAIKTLHFLVLAANHMLAFYIKFTRNTIPLCLSHTAKQYMHQ